ncbi:DUF3576 domain-containing protein [Roseobacter denitrificans]|uniref:Conserved domain protein n=1 Tax=Roseobacter denitrificans (strain ATCC 33942 / OCh 114) TaxID=375451 RepID=Q16E07_ROSDO|nr:DUF3576 domain-containing protein [Roseobacter denitrificans]ABG29786.1 conserved domain protein [Roseobacter denitrificans OCh 114]AVL53015.1 DUF3576 domain-containing protein [Roseobacter denitrificans]SFG27119.1 protein of unknown function [Roseobacter denitrificans OCh 114]
MQKIWVTQIITGMAVAAALSGCGVATPSNAVIGPQAGDNFTSQRDRNRSSGTTIWDAFRAGGGEQTVAVNKYLWAASLEVLNFLPVESVDPFTGVIITGFGTPPGSGRAYRATILIDDPALDARSLNVSLQTRNGPASAPAVQAVENAILSRARQLRIADDAL